MRDVPPRLHGALRELGDHEARSDNWLYWFRRAGMDKLMALGLVEMWRPKSLEHSRRKSLPYRLTDAARAALAEQEKGEAAPTPSTSTTARGAGT